MPKLIRRFIQNGYKLVSKSKESALIKYDPLEIIIKNKRTMVSKTRLKNLCKFLTKFNDTNHSFVECGVAKGGCLALMKYYSKNNKVFGFDSFEGMPLLTSEDKNSGEEWVNYNCSGYGIQAVYDTFTLINIDFKNVFVVKGYFEETLKKNISNIGKIAILRLDNDWYKSTKFCLETLYDNVINGGVIIIDDYGTFIGCKKAVNDFRKNRNIKAPLIETENGTEWYWIK